MPDEEEFFSDVLSTDEHSDYGFIRFDEFQDVLASMHLLSIIAPLIRSEASLWKWMIVGTHNALQGAMVCALRDTTGTSVLSDKSAGKVLAYLENRDECQLERPVERLASFDVLIDRCLAGTPTLTPIKLVDEQIADIRRLHDQFRNNFAHFVPKGWSIEKQGLPRIIKAALLAIELLMNSDRPMIHMSDEQRQRLVSELRSIKTALEAA